MKKIILAFVLIVLFAMPCLGSDNTPCPVRIIAQCSDLTGCTLVSRLTDLISISKTMNLVDDEYQNRYEIIVTSLPYDPSSPDAATMYSVVWILVIEDESYYIDSMLGYTPNFSATDVAIEIFSKTQDLIAIDT